MGTEQKQPIVRDGRLLFEWRPGVPIDHDMDRFDYDYYSDDDRGQGLEVLPDPVEDENEDDVLEGDVHDNAGAPEVTEDDEISKSSSDESYTPDDTDSTGDSDIAVETEEELIESESEGTAAIDAEDEISDDSDVDGNIADNEALPKDASDTVIIPNASTGTDEPAEDAPTEEETGREKEIKKQTQSITALISNFCSRLLSLWILRPAQPI